MRLTVDRCHLPPRGVATPIAGEPVSYRSAASPRTRASATTRSRTAGECSTGRPSRTPRAFAAAIASRMRDPISSPLVLRHRPPVITVDQARHSKAVREVEVLRDRRPTPSPRRWLRCSQLEPTSISRAGDPVQPGHHQRVRVARVQRHASAGPSALAAIRGITAPETPASITRSRQGPSPEPRSRRARAAELGLNPRAPTSTVPRCSHGQRRMALTAPNLHK